jgi:predicted transcriptional regulator
LISLRQRQIEIILALYSLVGKAPLWQIAEKINTTVGRLSQSITSLCNYIVCAESNNQDVENHIYKLTRKGQDLGLKLSSKPITARKTI